MRTKTGIAILLLLLSLCSFGRKFRVDTDKQIDSLKEVEDAMSHRGSYDSVIAVCKYALTLNNKYAKQEHIDMDLILAYFDAKHFDEGVKQGKRYLRTFDMPAAYNRTAWSNRIWKGFVCNAFYEMYAGQKKYKMAIKYLKLELRKYTYSIDNTWLRKSRIYDKLIESYTALGDTKNADRCKQRQDRLRDK